MLSSIFCTQFGDEEIFYPGKRSKWAAFKTKICQDYFEKGWWKQGDLCFCTHSNEEIRDRSSAIPIRIRNEFNRLKQIENPDPVVFVSKEHFDYLNNELEYYKRIYFLADIGWIRLNQQLKEAQIQIQKFKTTWNTKINNKHSNVNQENKVLTRKIQELTNSLKQSKQSNKNIKSANGKISRDFEYLKSEFGILKNK